jgi:hypothetical protein
VHGIGVFLAPTIGSGGGVYMACITGFVEACTY